MLAYTAVVTLLVVLFYFFLGTRVSAARAKYGVKLPATSGHPDFERVLRVHMNTLEWMPIFLPLLWLCAFYYSDSIAALLGLLWIAGRIAYFVGYAQAVEKRLVGFLIQSIACVLLLVLAAIGISWQLG
jgi:glutathione S-transferase